VLHGAGGNESAWSGWSNKSNLWAELGGKPAGTAPETASDVVSTATSATCRAKEDGTIRLLGISCIEDKIVQEMTRRILEAIYEPVFIKTSYGYRQGRVATMPCDNSIKR